MKKLTVELRTKKDNHEFIFALREAVKQIEEGNEAGNLINEDIESGYWEITEE